MVEEETAWIIGNEPYVAIDFTGTKEYVKK